MDNAEVYNPRDLAGRVIPAVSLLLCDPEKMFLEKLEEISNDEEKAQMYRPKGQAQPNGPNSSNTSASSASSAGPEGAQGSGWAGWMASSAVNLTMAAASASMAAASKMRKNPETGAPIKPEPEKIEVVVGNGTTSPGSDAKSPVRTP